jgi:amino acid adenylation domain-containing protein
MPLVLPPDLTVNQTAVWLDHQLFTGKPVCNTGAALSIRGKLRADLFETALRETVAENPGLQLPPWSGPVPFNLLRLDFRDEKDPLASAEQWMRTEMRRVIPLEDAALFRFALIRVGEEHTLWFQKFHHIIMDATGRQLLSERTARRYRGLRFGEPLPALNTATPKELLDAERHYADSSVHEADRHYWLQQLNQWPPSLLEVDRQSTERARSGCHARTTFTIKRADFTRLETTARELGSSAFRAIIALTYVAFARLCNRYDIVLGLELANRSDARAKQAIGHLARPLPMILALDQTKTIADAIRQIDETRTRNYPHRHFPILEVAREVGITRRGNFSLFDIIVNYLPNRFDFTFEEFPVELTNLSYSFAAPWLVTIADTGSPRDVTVTVDTDSGLISADMAAQLASCFETLLLHGLDDPACPLGLLPIMPEAARAKVLNFVAGETVALPGGTTLATLCATQAERTPDAIALICGQQQLSFAMLHSQATRLARRLAAVGVRPGVVVGIALPRTPNLIVAVLAIHKAGGAYLPLDPSYPAERIRFIVTDAAAPVIVTNSTLSPVFAGSGARLVFDAESAGIETGMAEPIPACPSDLAYVLYTSGSTGRPKGVGVEHRNVINFISWGRSIVSDAELRGLLFSTSLNFDISVFEMFLPLAFGGCVILVENLLALQSAPQRDKIRFVNTSPSLLDALLHANGLPLGVTSIILAGEKLSRRLANSLFGAVPGIRLLNCYGPTETTVYSSWAPVDPGDHSEPTIGHAIWNTTLYVLDRGRSLLPPGVEGELFIGGAGVARGYLGRPELTAERFLPNSYGPGQIYRTGDRVRWLPDGELEYIGRADDQIKINGIRVEPGEIEATLMTLPGIAAAVVTFYRDAAGVPRLTAYLVPSPGVASATEKVRAALEKRLPRNMLPTFFVWLDAMPMTPNGKLDRKALPAPSREEAQVTANDRPKNTLEYEIAEIWQDLLQKSPIGVRSDFFDIGGDSLALVSLFATIEERFGRCLTIDVVSGDLTVAGLARVLAEEIPQPADSGPIVPLQPLGQLPSFFCVHGIGGDVLHLYRFAVHMGTDRPFIGLRRPPEAPLADTISDMAARYVSAMLSRQPSGPFYLGGHSFGATVAFEMARQLVAQGHEIGLLAIVDQRSPEWRMTPRNAIPVLHRFLPKMLAGMRDAMVEEPATSRFRHIGRILKNEWPKMALGLRKAPRSLGPAPILLVRTDAQPLANSALDSTLGWGDLTTSDVRVRTVLGDHRTITREPFVRQLAKILSDELDSAQGVQATHPRTRVGRSELCLT